MADGDALTDDFAARFNPVLPTATAAPAPNVPALTTVATPLGPQPLPPAPPAAASPSAPPWVPAAGAAAPARPSVPGASPELNAAIAAATANIGQQQQRMQQREAAQAPIIEAGLKGLDQPLPQRQPSLQPPPVPKREELMSGLEQWMIALATVAGVMGGRGRTHATNAMAAMTGAIEGMNEGNQQKFEQNMKVWDAESKRVNQINTQSRNEYLDALNDRKLRAEEKTMALQLIAQRYDDKAIQQLGSDWRSIAQLIHGRDQLNQTAVEYEQGLRGIGSRFGAGARTMTDEALMQRVDQYLSGFPASQYQRGLRSGSADEARFSELAVQEQLRRGMSMADVRTQQANYAGSIAGGRSTGVRVANLERLQYSVIAVGNEAVRASDAVPRGRFVPINRLQQIGRAAISDPAQRQFLVAHETLVDTWGQMLKPQGIVDVGLRERLTNDLNTADSPATYRAAVEEIKKLIGLERKALEALQTRDPAAFEAVMRGEPNPAADAAVDTAVKEGFKGTSLTVHPDPGRYGVRSIEVVP